MTEPVVEPVVPATPTMEELATQIATLTESNQKLTQHNETLFSEAKTAKGKAKELETAAETATRLAAEKNGDFEQLHKSSETERQKLSDELTELRGGIATEKRNNTALKMAGELAEGANAELLSEFIKKRIKYTDEGIKVIDSSGNLTVATVEDLKKEFIGDARYSALLTGNKATGGGATGGKTSGGAAKEVDRAGFESMDAGSRMKFIKAGGKVL